MTDRRAWWLILFLAFGLLAYHLPWFDHATAGFTMHGYDLAEWTSLHPAVRGSSPPLLTSFLLRLPLAGVIVGIALAANWLSDVRAQWLVRAAAALLVLRFIPPSDFYSGAGADPNYRQMALLTLIGLAAVALAWVASRVAIRWRVAAFVSTMAISAGASWWGLSRADILLGNFEIDATVGSGPVLLTLALATASVYVLGQRTDVPRREMRGTALGPNKEKGG